jgi:ketosteroid isomerase-like protein
MTGANAVDEAAQRELDAVVVGFGEAWARGDVDSLKAMLSPGYTHTDVWGGILDRDTWLQYAGNRAGAATVIAFADVSTRVVGDVAIITGRNDMAGQTAIARDGRTAGRIRFTQVWVRRDGRWLREAFQATFVNP